MGLYDEPPLGEGGMGINADQRGRIIGSCVAIFIITDIFVLLRLVSRKLARAGYWARIPLSKKRMEKPEMLIDFLMPSGMMFWL